MAGGLHGCVMLNNIELKIHGSAWKLKDVWIRVQLLPWWGPYSWSPTEPASFSCLLLDEASSPIPFSFIFILLIYLVNSTQTTLYMCTAFYIAFFLLPFFHLPVFLFISCIREPFRILSSLTSMQIKLVMHLYQEKKRYKCEQNQFIKFMKSKFIKK